jgi:hypothetical protein
MQFFQLGSRDSRLQLLRGQADFAIAGVPFTAAELSARPADAGEIITVPLSVGSTTIAVGEPAQVGWATATLPCTIDEYLQGLCDYVPGPPLDTVRIPPEPLSALITGESDRRYWNNPDMIAALGTGDLLIQRSPKAHTFLNRTEPATQNEYLMQYAATLGPLAWAETKASDPGFPWDPIGEVFSPRTPSKYGLDTQLGLMSLDQDPISGSAPTKWSGNMGPIPTTLYAKLASDYPARNYRVAQIQNAHGDWVVPTRATLDAALAAGFDPIIATKQDVPGAYPLVFINDLFAVAGTLTPEKANSLAAFIRYTVTDGQQLVIDDGGTDLPDALRAKALAAADQIVIKNCTATGYEVTTSGPSAFETTTPKVQALTAMKHCTLRPPPPPTTTTTSSTTTSTTTSTTSTTTTTTTTTTSPPSQASSSPVVTVSSRSSQGPPPPVATSPPPTEASTSTTVPEATTTTTIPSTTTTVAPLPQGGGASKLRGVALSQLPMVKPTSGAEQVSRLGTFMLGAALFLFIRRLLQLRTAASHSAAS